MAWAAENHHPMLAGSHLKTVSAVAQPDGAPSVPAPGRGRSCSFDPNANLTQTPPPPVPAGGGTRVELAQRQESESPPRSHTIVLADDHPSVRCGLKRVLAQHPEFEVVGEAGDGLAALALINNLHPDLLICDLSMPGLHGLELTRRTRSASAGTRIIVFSVHADEPYLVQALGCGASGYVLKSASSVHLFNAMRAALNGLRYLSPPFTPALLG